VVFRQTLINPLIILEGRFKMWLVLQHWFSRHKKDYLYNECNTSSFIVYQFV